MLSNVLRDAELVGLARDAVAPLHAYLEEAAATLTSGRQARGQKRQLLKRALRHALAFPTWRSLSTKASDEQTPPSSSPPLLIAMLRHLVSFLNCRVYVLNDVISSPLGR
jgi:hypothetical protein